MPKLAALTDYDTMGNATGTQSVAEVPTSNGLVENVTNKLLGLNGQERYQLWPEKVVRSGLSAVHDAYEGKIPQWEMNPNTGEFHTSPQMIERALDMSALAGTGGLAGTTDATLGATPFLRPALKHNGKLYKGKPGQEHADVIPEHLYNDYAKKAMSGEDMADYNFGFMNDKGHFLDRETALKYGIDNGLIDPTAAKTGALISTIKQTAPIENFMPAIKVKNKIYQDGAKGDHPGIEAKNKLQGMSQEDGFVDNNGNFLNRSEFEKRFGISESDDLKTFQNPNYKFKPVDYDPFQ